MGNCDCAKFCCNLASKIYLTINLSTLILIYFLPKNKFYEDECFLQKVYYSELDPISEIYYTSFKTNDSIQLGYLEKYSGKYITIYPQEIYKWKNYYINVKRNKSEIPNTNNDYAYNNEETRYVNLDIKVSFRNKLQVIYKRNSNICFSKECVTRNGYCEISFIYFDRVSEDSSQNFISDNAIQISSKNPLEFYDPEFFDRYIIKRQANFTQKEGLMDLVDIYKKIMTSILFLNPALRLIKIFLLSCLTVNDSGFCTLINLFFLIIHAINAALFLALIIYYIKLPDEDYTLVSIQIALVILEFFCLILGIVINYKPFSDKPNFSCYCDWCDKDIEEQKIEEIKEGKGKISKEIENIKQEYNDYKLEMDKNQKNLENILFEIKKINAEKEEINYKLYLNREHKKEYDRYNNLPNELTKMETMLQKRLEELEKLKEMYDKKKLVSNKFSYNEKNKLDLNCIYYDGNINAADCKSSEYEFFKFLKYSINGVFFGIKKKADLRFIKVQLPQDVKFILIFHGNDDDFPFLQTYHSYFSHIIIFNNDKDEIIKLKKLNNIYAIESDYKNIFLRLKEINIQFNEKNIKKYKPRNLYLLDDYIENNNIRKCQLEILKYTFLDKDLNNIKNISTQGLTENEFDNFIKFIDNDLKEIRDLKSNEKIDIDDFSDEEEKEDNNINDNDNESNNRNRRNKRDEVRLQLNDFMPTEELGLRIRDNNNRISMKDTLHFEVRNRNEFSIPLANEPELPNINLTNIAIRTRKLGNIEKTPKRLIKALLSQDSNYKTSEIFIHLYTKNKEKFDFYINRWLFSLNYNIYKEIAPIVGKMMNKIYELIIKRNNPPLNKKKLYRGFGIKKADIFLYKACEGDVFFYPSFTSTSSSKEKVKKIFIKYDPSFNYKDLSQICNCLITIDYNLKNDDVRQEADLKENTRYEEEERLFPPFSFFRIKKVKYNVKGENNKKGKIYDGTKSNPFRIKLEIIHRNFYLDSAIIKHQKFHYVRDTNRWKLK